MSKQILPTLKRGEDDKAVPVKNIKRVNGGKATGQLVRENEKDMRLEQENKKDERIKHYKRIVRHTGITPLQKATGAILVPEMTTKDRQELEAARIFVEKNMTEQDEMDDEDISMVAEYSQENFEHLRTLEELHKPLTRDGDHQSEESWIARAELMDWLVKVHDKYNLVHESLFLAVNYFDRYFLANKDKDVNLKLIGAASLLIATKYEAIATKYEGDCLDHGRLVEQLVEKARNTFTREELLKAMRLMIKKLNYSLGWPDPMRFLRRISRADGYGSSPGDISEYFLYITVVDKHFVGCAPSFLSAGVYCLRRYMLGKGQWVFLCLLLVVGRLTEYSRNATYITLVTH
jgi:G2/mitotic-specific cyclin 3/4